MYLDDVSAEFLSTHRDTEYRSPGLRPYAFNDFDTFMQRTKKSYENPRASNNLDKVQAQLKETTQIMSKNLEDLLYRGDSLDRMGQMSSDLRESSKKYKRAAVRINWELLLKQVREGSQDLSWSPLTEYNSTVPLLLSAPSSCSSSSGASGKRLSQQISDELMPLTIQRKDCMYGVGNPGNLLIYPFCETKPGSRVLRLKNIIPDSSSDLSTCFAMRGCVRSTRKSFGIDVLNLAGRSLLCH
jgi:hypothetical protein